MKTFTPDDLKAYYPGKYDDSKFAKNGRGEWVVIENKTNGVIVTKTDDNGKEYPEVVSHNRETIAPGMGAVAWSIGRLFRSNKKTE